MRSASTGRATPVAQLNRSLQRGIATAIVLLIIACLTVPTQVLAYREEMSELVIGGSPGLIVQNQSYTTTTRQNLFHSATNAVTDTEDFALGDSREAGIQLAQTSDYTAMGTETGFYNSTASTDLVPPAHIGNGFLGTWADDPIWTGVPIFAGLTFPQMTATDQGALASRPQGLAPASNNTTAKNNTAAKNNATGNKTQKGIAFFRPVIDYDANDTIANNTVANNTIPRPSAGNASVAANATKPNASSKNATGKPAATPAPVIKPGQPFYHQQNKPFSANLTAPSGPFKATAAQTQNTTGFNRFLRNTVGRSTTDKAFNGTTSSPTYISPGEALAVQIPYDFIQGARGMTMPGTHLNYRAWPL